MLGTNYIAPRKQIEKLHTIETYRSKTLPLTLLVGLRVRAVACALYTSAGSDAVAVGLAVGLEGAATATEASAATATEENRILVGDQIYKMDNLREVRY